MTPRERVLTALRHQQPDRTPVDFLATNEIWHGLLKELQIDDEGAKIALFSFRERQVAQSLPSIVEYHELSGRADFNDSFVSLLKFPELEALDLVLESV